MAKAGDWSGLWATPNVDLKGKRLLDYINMICVTKSKKFLQALTKTNDKVRAAWLL